MLHMIALILKILGIVLAVILGIIVLLVCIVFFVPVRYEIHAKFPGKMEELVARVRFSWLLHLIAGEVRYAEKELHWKLRTAWLKFCGEEAREPDVLNAETKAEAKEAAEKVEGQVTKMSESVFPKEEFKEEEAQTESKKPEPQKSEPQEKETEEKISFLQKIINKIKLIWEKIKCTFLQIRAKIINVSELKDRIVLFLMDETHKQAFFKAKSEINWIIRFLKPKKFKLNLHYGFEDPYTTGQVLAVLSMIYPFVGDNMDVRPDFENQVMEGGLYIKGNLRMIFPAVYMIKLILNKNVRKTFIDVKNFKLK